MPEQTLIFKQSLLRGSGKQRFQQDTVDNLAQEQVVSHVYTNNRH